MQTDNMLIVDGYNIINKWPELLALKRKDLCLSRDQLISIIQHYCDFSEDMAVIVFDGNQNAGDVPQYHDVTGRLSVSFSKRNESADGLICRLVSENKPHKDRIIVATDDNMLKNLVFGMGAFDISADNLKQTISYYIDELNNNAKC